MKYKLSYQFTKIVEVVAFSIVFSMLGVSCMNSDSGSKQLVILEDETTQTENETAQPEAGEARPPSTSLLQVYTETGISGMRVTYSPANLTLLTEVSELEKTFQSVMSCVGMITPVAPNILYTDDHDVFTERPDGAEIDSYYDEQSASINIFADDLDASLGNRLYWTRHGMIEYLISAHGLESNSPVSPFLDCHYSSE